MAEIIGVAKLTSKKNPLEAKTVSQSFSSNTSFSAWKVSMRGFEFQKKLAFTSYSDYMKWMFDNKFRPTPKEKL